MSTPLPFVWPYWLAFWLVFLWAYAPELRIIRAARRSTAANPGSPDAGSVEVIRRGMGLASLVAFPLAWVSALRIASAMALELYVLGIALLIGGSLLRRHCWRVLGESFTGDVRAHAQQRVVTAGAYALVRHPSYTAGIVMNLGLGVALNSWGSVLLLGVSSVAVYIHRMNVEERVLLAAIGEPYHEFMRTRRRLVPFVY